jgi:hypothetical protein
MTYEDLISKAREHLEAFEQMDEHVVRFANVV